MNARDEIKSLYSQSRGLKFAKIAKDERSNVRRKHGKRAYSSHHVQNLVAALHRLRSNAP